MRNTVPQVGMTDVNPFVYDSNQGKCLISEPYCTYDMNVSYKIDEKGRPTCYSTVDQEIGEFLVGKTIFRGLRHHSKHSKNIENFQHDNHHQTTIRSSTLIGKDFAGKNVNLYLVQTTKNFQIGFDFDEIRQAYPNNCSKNKLKFSLAEMQKDSNKKRIFVLDRQQSFLGPFFLHFLAMRQKK
jgi:hypothetical protein